ncbi:MAG: LytTR family DNA-binding domain-containing protein [Bacilli bacterium]|nr:LytTR family DNA-binding domain-containing protein [Bacilli bacterium]
MINYIICDDNEEILNNIATIIDKVMMKNKLAYKKHLFKDYNQKFEKLIKEKMSNKIYILDIEVPRMSGIDVARKIREKDVESVIIFLTSHEELGYIILKDEFLFLTFISKFNNYENHLRSSLKKAMLLLGKRTVLRFEDQNILYTIPLNDILYVTRDSVERKVIIKTDYTEFRVNKSLLEIRDLLDKRFRQSHRACLINTDRVISINFTKKEILFDNNLKIDLLTSNYRKEVKQ